MVRYATFRVMILPKSCRRLNATSLKRELLNHNPVAWFYFIVKIVLMLLRAHILPITELKTLTTENQTWDLLCASLV
jgi:hypothetical protein